MIIYDLKCDKNHKFEGWFNDRAAYEAQRARKLITCPICGSSGVEMVPSTISIMGRETKEAGQGKSKEVTPLKAVQLFQEFINRNFDDVGDRFAEVALKIHKGEEERRNIKGTTTKEDEDTLKEAGVEFFKISIPKLDS